MVENVRKTLFQLQDLEYQKFQSKLCPGIDNIIGVRIPELRKLAKKLLKEDYISFLMKVDNTYYEETMLEGILIASSKMPLNDKFSYLKRFLPKIDNWAVCDICVSSFHFQDKDLESVWDFIIPYQNRKAEYELRFLVVMMMNYFLISKYVEDVFRIIDSIQVDYYYTNMAIAWLISMAFIVDKERTLFYLQHNHLSNFTYQKALQKIIESNRVSKKDKEMIRRMKGRQDKFMQ